MDWHRKGKMGNTVQPDKLILFDVDGTLLHGGTSARESLASAMSEVTGHEITLRTMDVAGNTDLGIFHHTLGRYDYSTDEINTLIPDVIENYLEIVAEAYPSRNDQYLFPGIPELLERLDARDDIRLGLLTGNMKEGARIKLKPFDIWHYFPIGAFGSDSADRNDLPGVAVKKAQEKLGEQYAADQILIVGDTARDALCGEANDIRTLIIARRPEWLEEIQKYEPYRIVDSSENVDELFNIIVNFRHE